MSLDCRTIIFLLFAFINLISCAPGSNPNDTHLTPLPQQPESKQTQTTTEQSDDEESATEETEALSEEVSSETDDITEEDACPFVFGQAYSSTGVYAAQTTFLTAWAGGGDGTSFWTSDFLRYANENDYIPFYYAYFIPFVAREEWGLQDCNLAEDEAESLCYEGARFIRENRTLILERYNFYAQETAERIGDLQTVWLLEPDFSQYQDSGQTGGGLTQEEVNSLVSEIIATIQLHLPNAIFALHISPWLEDQDSYFSQFDLDPISFLFASGDPTERFNVSDDHNGEHGTWGYLHLAIGLPILADVGFDTTDEERAIAWSDGDTADVLPRIQEGVFGVNLGNAGLTEILAGELDLPSGQQPLTSACPD